MWKKGLLFFKGSFFYSCHHKKVLKTPQKYDTI